MGDSVIDQWETEKRKGQDGDQEGQETPSANGTSGALSRRRIKAARTVSDSSSEDESQQEEIIATTDPFPDTNGLEQQANDLTETPSSIEIAETQQDGPQRAGVAVEVPRATIDLNDYESLHSSQLPNSDGLVQTQSSPLLNSTSPSAPSQPHLHGSALRITGAASTISSSQENTSSDEIKRPESARLRWKSEGRHDNLAVIGLQRLDFRRLAALRRRPFPHPQPVTRGLLSSPLSPNFVPATDFAPSTQDSATQQEKSLVPETTPQHPHGRISSPWNFQTQAPAQSLLVADDTALLVDTTTDGKRLHQSPTRSNVSVYSAEQRPARHSPLFCSPNSSRPKSASPISSFGDDFVINTIESDVLHATDMDSVAAVSDPPEPAVVGSIAPQITTYDPALGGSALPIQNSIEEEDPPSNEEPSSSESKGCSSQQSNDIEVDVPQIAGLVQPSLPILAANEYVLALPCEGKIQSTYFDTIKAKEKSIRKFLSRNESIGSADISPDRTHERNEMNTMMQLLHDTVTHMDLGLPGTSTQYSINSQENAAYANYAGPKFSFLGHLIDRLQYVGLSIVVVSREGQIQDLLEQYLRLKHVVVRRQDRIARSKSPAPNRLNTDFQVELVSSWSTHRVDIRSKPCLMIAFDASFDPQDPQVARIRARFENAPRIMPVVHLLVSNSSEHVDLCLPKNLPSPIRLKALVRYTYRASPKLGGPIKWRRIDSDVPEGRHMDSSDVQRALRKSAGRRLQDFADMIGKAAVSPDFAGFWTLSIAPALELTDVDEKPSKRPSRPTTRPETPKDIAARSRTPLSRSGTPSGRKRLLDVDGFLPALTKRQRLTPLRDSVEVNSAPVEPSNQSVHLQELLKKIQADLAIEKQARRTAEQERDHVKEQLKDWQHDHGSLQRRYEKRTTKCHELDKEKSRLLKIIENNKTRQERSTEDNASLRQKISDLQKELASVRGEIKDGGGDLAVLETMREEVCTLAIKNTTLEKSLENTRKDFEFTRSQYQHASTKAMELAGQVNDLEKENAILSKQASDEKRRLGELNAKTAASLHLAKVAQLEQELKSRDGFFKKIDEENKQLRRSRGVQTRGSSVQPPGSPALDGPGGRGTRSRQGSPAPGLVPGSHRAAERGSLLRNER